jgi:hypothetical protein
MKRPLLWVAVAGVATTVFLITRKTKAAPVLPTTPPPQTYGESTRVALAVPAGWRRATNSDVAALPELGTRANALRSTPGFTSMAYGTLAPFVASNGVMYATWVEQHYHEPGGAAKPWGLHHGVTLLVSE